MKKIQGKKARLINQVYITSLFLIIGIIRPIIIYFLNIDIFIPTACIALILLIISLIFVKENIMQKRNLFNNTTNVLCIVSVPVIMKSESIIITSILTLIICTMISLNYNEKFKVSKLNKPISYISIIIILGVMFTYFTQDYMKYSSLYDASKEYKSCSIIKELPIPINAKERNYKLKLNDIQKSTGYRIRDIGMCINDENPKYISKLEKDGWIISQIFKSKFHTIYILQKDENTIAIKLKTDSIVVGVYPKLDEDKYIKEKIKSMTLDEKIGQMIVSGFNGTTVNEEINTLVNELKVGGVILFSRNIENSNQLKKLNSDISNLNKDTELFISVDEEGGRVSRLPSDTNKFKSSKAIGDTNDSKYAYENGKNIGLTLKEHMFNMDFAPVLDIYSNPKNTVIGDRAFGTDEKIVSDMGIATMNGIKENDVIPVVKHFPGHGDTEVDSHFGLPIVSKSLSELEQFEFIPFKKAIDKSCDVVMVSHIILEAVDKENPSTLSEKVVTDILRNDLGFDGVTITDDMQMKAITNNLKIEKASIESIKAGMDIILIGSDINSVKSTIEEIKKSIENNEINEKRIDESVYRILKLKNEYKMKV